MSLSGGDSLDEEGRPRTEQVRDKMTWTNVDGLRGLGSIIVILYHMGYRVARHGWFCIYLFFFLSGFLITGITVRTFDKTGSIDVVRFWSHRVGRLFPALFLVIILCALSRFVRIEDEAELANERDDLLWSCSFMLNYYMVFIRKDDYFANFTKPSLTRHLWTLSIEEQYYLLWPLIFYLWTKCVPTSKASIKSEGGRNSIGSGTESSTDNENEVECLLTRNEGPLSHDPARPFIKALCVGECIVIAVSYFSSLQTIAELGMSAAYYSTWSRMGDFACGGLFFLLVRLQPQLYRRIKQEPGLQPMTTSFRIILEILWFLALCVTIFTPMLQFPLDDFLHAYFYYLRVPYSFVTGVFLTAGTIQISEPLPRWAIFSRALSSKLFTTLGVISYGVYLNHWPLIVFFGTPIDHTRFESGEEKATDGSWDATLAIERDAALLLSSLAIGFACFVYFEKPLLMRARNSKPWKTIACGLLCAVLTACFVKACFWDLHDFDGANDVDEIFGGQLCDSFDGALPDFPFTFYDTNMTAIDPFTLTQITPIDVVDTRFTPLHLFTGVKGHRDVYLASFTDQYTTPTAWLKCKVKSLGDTPFGCADHANEELYERQANVTAEGSVIIMCKSYSSTSPCDAGDWKKRTKWIWLDSALLCGDILNATMSSDAHDKRCPEKVLVSSLTEQGTNKTSSFLSYTGRQDLDLIYLMTLVLSVEKTIPGSINFESVKYVHSLLRVATAKELDREHALLHADAIASRGSKMKVLSMGESIATRIATLGKELLESHAACLGEGSNSGVFPLPEVIDVATRGVDTVNFFLPCEADISMNMTLWGRLCSEEKQVTKQHVLGAIPRVKPDIVLLKDGHWIDDPDFEPDSHALLLEGMRMFLRQALDHGTKHVFFLTHSCSSEHRVSVTRAEEKALGAFLEQNRCDEESRGIPLSIVSWHKLTCPTFDENTTECPKGAHGFPSILPDDLHPSGPSGEWLVSQIYSTVMAQMAMELLPNDFGSWKTAMLNPVSSCLLKSNKPDNDPPLEALIRTHSVCP